MSKKRETPRRERVERNIYRRGSGVYEVGFKDATGRQRWRTVAGGITAARALRDQVLAQRARGEQVADHGRLRFGDAAERWLGGPVVDLRPATQGCYRNAVEQHLLGRFKTRRLDAITPDDLANLVRELRTEGLAESTIVIVVGVTNRIYRYAARRLGWVGTNPVSLVLSSERPKASRGKRRRIFEGVELEQTIAAADEPYRTLFTVAALTGARLSELLGLTWERVQIDDLELEFAFQVDRRGQLAPAKTDGSARTVPIPAQLARILASHRQRSPFASPADFVFCTRTGKAFSQRNIGRALRAVQKQATMSSGEPTFPALHVVDEAGAPVPVPHGAIPSMRSFATRSRAAPCSPAKASTRSRSCSGTLTRMSPARSTYASSLTSAADRCADRRWSLSSPDFLANAS